MASGNSSGNGARASIRPLTSADAFTCGGLVFRSLRPKLYTVSSDEQTFGVCADVDGATVGVLVAEEKAPGNVRVVSLFVAASHRGQGLSTALLQEAEHMARQRSDAASLQIGYLADRGTTPALEAALRSAGWDEPKGDLLLCKAVVGFEDWPLYMGKQGCSDEFVLFPWTELSADDRRWIETTQEQDPWIPKDLYPLQFSHEELEPVNSLGIRHGGRPVGWVLTHRVAPDTIRYTTSFIHRNYQRGLHIFPAYRAAAQLQQAAGIPKLTWMVPWEHRSMARWVLKRWPKELITVEETRTCSKPLHRAEVPAHQEETLAAYH